MSWYLQQGILFEMEAGMKSRLCFVVVVTFLFFYMAVEAGDRLPFQGDEFIVNSTTTGNQTVPSGVDIVNFTSDDPAGPAIDTDDAGNYVIVWTDEYDGDGSGIFARGFTADGIGLFAQMQVNVGITGVQENPHVAVDADGDFVVTWESDPTGSNLEIFASGFTADGSPRFAEFKVNTIIADKDEHPRLDMMDNGDFIIAWDSGIDDQTPGTKEVHFRRFLADSTPVDGADVIANWWTRGNQRFPDPSFDSDGNFVITWQSGAGGTDEYQDGDVSGIFARIFDASGIAIDVSNLSGQCFDVCATAVPGCNADELIFPTKEICVNDYTIDSQDMPRVARNDRGEFVITWHSAGSDGVAPPGASRTMDDSANSVHAKRFDSDGNAQGDAWQVNSFILSEQVFPDVAIGLGGGFVISWSSLFQEVNPAVASDCADGDIGTILSGACDAMSEVYSEEYNADGTVRNAEFRINTGFVNPAPMTALDGIQVYPAVDVADTGVSVTAWATGPPPSPFPGASSDAQDGDGWGAMARNTGLVDSLLFADGFESGDLLAWSDHNP